eukprot:4712271-Pleurochrysis_carterae.AAC.1
MACGDNPEANMTLSISLLWIQTEDYPREASWQYQSSQTTAQEYAPHSLETDSFYDSSGNPVAAITPASLVSLVKETLASALSVPADFGENAYLLSSTELGTLRFRHGSCCWEIVEADDLSAANVRKFVEIPGFCPQARIRVASMLAGVIRPTATAARD